MDKITDAIFEAIEEEMTDAGKADDPKMVTFSLAVSTEPMRGKTLLLMFLIDALADAGLLTPLATRQATMNLKKFVIVNRTTDDAFVEGIELDIDLNGLIEKARLGQLML